MKNLSVICLMSMCVIADGAFAQAQPKGPSALESFIIPMAILFTVMYFFMIRPQVKKQKQHDELLKSIKPGDEVVTSGGIIAKVRAVADHFVTLETSPSATLKVQKVHIVATTKSTP